MRPEGDSIPLMEVSTSETAAPEQWDYVLVADRRTQRSPRRVRQQRRFLEDLERKGFRYTVGWRRRRAGAAAGRGARVQGRGGGCQAAPGEGSGEVAHGLALEDGMRG